MNPDVKITIRNATNADCARVRSLVFGILEEYSLPPDVDGTDRDLADIQASYFDRGGFFELLEAPGGKLLGTIGMYPIDDETIELRKMYFAPEIRGRGWGNRLLVRMIEKAREMGYLRIYLETATVLRQAVHLYEKYGFRPVDVKHTPRCDQAYILELS